MDKRKKILLIALVIVIIATAIMFWPKNKNSQEQKGKDGANNGGLSGTGPRDTPLGGGSGGTGGGIITDNGGGYQPMNPAFPLKNGSKNNYVKEVQDWLNHDNIIYKRGRAALVVDGSWGPKTQAALNLIFTNYPQMSEGDYNIFKSRRAQGLPAFLTDTTSGSWNWPLKLRDYGPRVKKLNVGLGLYPATSTDKMSNVFSGATLDAVNRKIGASTVTEAKYRQIAGLSWWEPA